MTATALLAAAALAVWIYLLLGRGLFWLARERDERNAPAGAPARWPSVTAIVPARNEADVVTRALASLLAQDYPGELRIILVDDSSTDGTGALARALDGGGRLEVLTGAPLPAGWTGKLWAVRQGVARAGPSTAGPDFLLLTDADIAHAPQNVRRLVERACADRLVLISLMARLTVRTWAERLLIPAFVFFFDMLYPFAWANNAARSTAAAAGGCMLVRREALEASGGIDAIRTEIIDDCALAARLKAHGPIWLGLTDRAESLRPYKSVGEIGRMVSRSAYAQLGFSPWLLAGTVLGMALIYLAPPLIALFGAAMARWIALAAWSAMALAFQPILRFYHRSPLWGVALPVIGALYTLFTIQSAIQVWRGRGGQWKGRAQAMASTS